MAKLLETTMTLSADRKLYLLSIFQSLSQEEDFSHTNDLTEDIAAMIANDSGKSPQKIVLDYARAMRHNLADNSESGVRAYRRSADLFRFAIESLSEQDNLPADIPRKDLLDAFSDFRDQALHTAPHAWYLAHVYDLLEDPGLIELLDKDLHPLKKKLVAQRLHSHIAARLNIDAAVVSDSDCAAALGVSRTRNRRMDETVATAKHEISLQLDCSVVEIVGTTLHETNHTYQEAAYLALVTYEFNVEKMVEAGVPRARAEEAFSTGTSDTDSKVPDLLKKICSSEDFKFFARYMRLADNVYPEDWESDIEGYLLNPLEIQAFDINDKVDEYLASDPTQRAEIRRQVDTVLLYHDFIKQKRAELHASLLKDSVPPPSEIVNGPAP